MAADHILNVQDFIRVNRQEKLYRGKIQKICKVIDFCAVHLIVPAFVFHLISMSIFHIEAFAVVQDYSDRKRFQKTEKFPGFIKVHMGL